VLVAVEEGVVVAVVVADPSTSPGGTSTANS